MCIHTHTHILVSRLLWQFHSSISSFLNSCMTCINIPYRLFWLILFKRSNYVTRVCYISFSLLYFMYHICNCSPKTCSTLFPTVFWKVSLQILFFLFHTITYSHIWVLMIIISTNRDLIYILMFSLVYSCKKENTNHLLV